jgi:DNA-directed RNA polymerase subunit H (RpoH/RPB5)
MTSQNTSSLISQIYKSRCVILELMKKQNYNITEYDGFSINEINTMKINNQLDLILSKNQYEEKMEDDNVIKNVNNEKKIYIKYYLGKSLRPNNLQEMIDDLFYIENILTKNDTLLVVVKDEVNETLLNTLRHIWESDKIFIILIPLQRLQFNILEHILVPPHRILNEAEKIKIKIRYNIINDELFPELSRFDPVAKAIGIRPGEVCEITRPSKTAITSFYYRICR